MAGFDFSKISSTLSNIMDTDLIDIGRKMEITNPDGSIGETDVKEPIYQGIPCHISFNSVDNANPNTIDTVPIIISITINCSINIDLQNNDYVTAYKVAHNGDILETYTGFVGQAVVTQSRKSVQLIVSKGI